MDSYITRGEHEEFAKRINDEDHRQNRRIELLEENIGQLSELTIAVSKLANSMEGMLAEQKEQGVRLKALEEVPAKRWNTVVVAVLTAIGSCIGTSVVAAIVTNIRL